MDDIKKLNKNQLINKIQELENKLLNKSNSDIKVNIINCLKIQPLTNIQLANKLQTTTGNINSYLTYLKNDGHIILTNQQKQKIYLTSEEYKNLLSKFNK